MMIMKKEEKREKFEYKKMKEKRSVKYSNNFMKVLGPKNNGSHNLILY